MQVEMNYRSNYWVPLMENKQKIMLELTCLDSMTNKPAGLTLVAVLDVSNQIEDDNRIENLKIALLFVINKLRFGDRLSIVTFSKKAEMLCPLQEITESSRREIKNKVKSLSTSSSSSKNLHDGLRVGLDILENREIQNSCDTTAIIVVSCGSSQYEPDKVLYERVLNVAVHIFALGGQNYNTKVLNDIACKSLGGTYSYLVNSDNLIKAVSVCLAGLLTVVVQDLTLTLTPMKYISTIKRVYAGNYFQSINNDAVNIKFGDLYSGEVRKVLVDLLLPTVDKEGKAKVLEVSHSYKSSFVNPASRGTSKAKAAIISVYCMRTVSGYPLRALPEVLLEETRIKTMKKMREAIHDRLFHTDTPDKQKIYNVKRFLEERKLNLHKTNELLELLSAELLELWEMENDFHKFEYGSSVLSSHERQRVAARGAHIENFLSFASRGMLKFLRQAEEFSMNPSISLTPVDEDEEA